MNKNCMKSAALFLPILLASCSSSASQEEINEATKRCGMATMIGLVTKCEVNPAIPSMDVRMVLQSGRSTSSASSGGGNSSYDRSAALEAARSNYSWHKDTTSPTPNATVQPPAAPTPTAGITSHAEFIGVCDNVANFLREGTKFSEGWKVRIFKQNDSSPAAECKLK